MTPVDRTLWSFLNEYAASAPRDRLWGDETGWYTTQEIRAAVASVAGRLWALGVRPGQRVALPAGRTVEAAATVLALAAVGAVAVLTDPRHPAPFPVPVDLTLDGPLPLETGEGDFTPPDGPAQAPAFLIFTSGSTGQPKGVLVSQYALVNNLVDSAPLGDYRPGDVALGALPMEHIFGLVLLAGTVVLRYALYLTGQTSAGALLKVMETQRITRMNAVPSLYLAMAEQAAGYDLSALRAGFIGGGPYTGEQFCRMEAALGMTLIPVYGMSECVGISCASWRDPQALRREGVGPFYAMNTARVVDDRGEEVPPGQEGEIWVKGPSRMVGYLGEDSGLDDQGFVHTGDLGLVDSRGRLHLTGRKKDIIIRNGVNLSPRPIEAALLSVRGVREAAVVALPHPSQGEAPWAAVVAEGGLTEAAILSALAPRLPKNHLPQRVILMDALPRTAAGKVDKPRLKEALEKWREA